MAIQLEISAQTPGLDAATADVDRLAKELAEAQRQAAGFGKETDKAGKELKDYKRPAENAAKATNKTSRAMGKGAAQAKAFGAALTSAKGALAATIAAVGTKELLEFAEAGAAIQVTTRNLQEIGVGIEKTREIAARLGGGSISQVELLISRVDAMGVSFDQMGGLADAALRISIERGEDSHKIFNKLIRAIATGKQTYLQQLGITLNLKEAWDDYAKSIGKTRAELTETEKATVSSKLAIQELNEAFVGRAPDKYASNIGEVRDRFNNLADSIKRLAGDALADLGAVLGGGALANFASAAVKSRTTQIEEQVKALEDAEARLESASAKGANAVGETVLALQEELGGDAFTAMMGLPGDTEITRVTAAYIGAQERIQTQLASARRQLQAQIERDEAEEDYQAALEAEQARQRAVEAAREKARKKAEKARKKAREKAKKEAERAERERLELRARLRAAYFDRRVAREFEQEEAARARRIEAVEKDARSAADAAAFALQSMSGESGFDAIEARYQIQRDAALTAAQAEIEIAQSKGQSIEQIERDLQYNLLTIEQERLAASRALTEQHINTATSMAQDSIAAVSAISNAVLGPEIAQLEARVEQLRADADAARGTALEAEAEKKLLAAEKKVAKARAKQARIDAMIGAADQGAQALGQIALAAANWANPVAAAAHGISAATHIAAAIAYGRMASVVGASVPTSPSAGGPTGRLGASRQRPDPAGGRRSSGSSGGGITVQIQGPIIGDGGAQLDAAVSKSVRRAQGVLGGTAGGRV